MPDIVVKLDEAGHVCGVAPGPPREGWIPVPDWVARNAFGHRLDHRGEWVCKTSRERREFERRHAPPAPAPSGVDTEIQRLVEVLERDNRPPLTAAERLVVLLARRVLS